MSTFWSITSTSIKYILVSRKKLGGSKCNWLGVVYHNWLTHWYSCWWKECRKHTQAILFYIFFHVWPKHAKSYDYQFQHYCPLILFHKIKEPMSWSKTVWSHVNCKVTTSVLILMVENSTSFFVMTNLYKSLHTNSQWLADSAVDN